MLSCKNILIVSNDPMTDSDICGRCKDAETITMPTGETYRVCAPSKWKSYECAAKQLVALKKPAARAELSQPAKGSRRP
jgi:hypothetical protein